MIGRLLATRLRSLAWLARPAGLLISLASLVWLIYLIAASLDDLKAASWQLDPPFLLLSLAAYSAGLLCAVAAWRSMMRALGYARSYRLHLTSYCAANLFKRLPVFVAHLAGRTLLYQRRGGRPAITLAAGATELLVSSVAAASVYLLLLPFSAPYGPAPTVAVAAIGLASSALLYTRGLNRLLRFLGRRASVPPLTAARVDLPHLAAWLGWHLAVVVLGGLVLFAFGRGIYALTPGAVPLLVQAWALAVVLSGVFFFVPASLGLREGAIAIALATAMPLPAATAIALLFRLWGMLLETLWAIVGLTLPPGEPTSVETPRRGVSTTLD